MADPGAIRATNGTAACNASVVMTLPSWRPLRPELAGGLVDARLQFHHAAQFLAALGISYLPARPDDSHTNMEWLESIDALASNVVTGSSAIRLAVSPQPFALHLLAGDASRATLPLRGATIGDAVAWIRRQLGECGLHSDAFTLDRHYTIPSHPVADSAAFDDSDATALEQLAAWFSNAASILGHVAATTTNASPVRCWPHHFDIATLIDVGPGATVGLGMEPGDVYYAEPYYYANIYPPRSEPLPALAGGGSWHTHEWTGAVLPGSRLGRDDQRAQIESFIESALR